MTALAAQTTVDITFLEIGEALARGERVTTRGFGMFANTGRAERVGRDPRTGERITRPASTSVSLKASRALKDAVCCVADVFAHVEPRMHPCIRLGSSDKPRKWRVRWS